MLKPLFPTESCLGPSRRRALPRAALLAALCPLAATAAPPASPLVLGTRDGLEVVLFPTPRPHVLRVLPAVVVVLRAGARVPAELEASAESLGGRSWRLPTPAPVAEATRWAAHADVEAATPDMLVPRRRTDFDDPGHGGQWYLEKLKADALFAVSLGAPETHVAVIDSATDISHPDLVEGVAAPWDTVDEDADPSPNRGDFCPQGVNAICDEHGTAVSGIIAARANNGTGIVGLCPQCTLVPIRLISDGETPISADVRAFEHAIAQDAAVINNSWGFVEATPAPAALAAVIRRAATETRGGLGAVVVFAAGNDDRVLEDGEITGLPEVLCVSAADSYGRPTAYTNRGASVDVAAPSATVTLAPGGGMTQTFGGTSAAAPVVSGLAAWALSVAPEMSAADLRALLVETAVQSPLITPDENGHHDVYGFGMVDPTALLARLAPPEPDAGLPDAGPPPADAVVEPGDAAPQPADMGPDPSVDANVQAEPDATSSASGGSDGGGGCQAGVGRSGAGAGFAALALMLLAGARRARRATATTSPNRTTDSGR
jgi:hypothetical protein